MSFFWRLLLLSLFANLLFAQNWIKLNGPEGGTLGPIITKGDTLIVGSGIYKAMIFLSTNGGNSWTKMNAKRATGVTGLQFTKEGGIAAALLGGQIEVTTDWISWRIIPLYYLSSLGKDDKGNLYAGGTSGTISISTDSGINWNVDYQYTYSDIFSFYLNKNNNLFATSAKWVFRKKDNQWSRYSLGDTVYNGITNFAEDTLGNLYGSSGGSGVLYISTDEGVTWKYRDTGNVLLKTEINSILFNKRFFVCGSNDYSPYNTALLISDDLGYTWKFSNLGLPGNIFCDGLAAAGDNVYLTTNGDGVYKSTNYGDSWFPVNTGLTAVNVLDICFDNLGNMYTAAWCSGLAKSTDKGITWKNIRNGLPDLTSYCIVSDHNGNLITGSEKGIFRSTDQGESWIRTNSAGDDFPYYLYVDSKNRVYAFTYGSGIFRTTDLGQTWTELNNNLSNGYFYAFAEDELGNLYSGCWGNGGTIYKSTDDGASWTLKKAGLIPNDSIERILVLKNGVLLAANDKEGVWRSTDYGETWSTSNSGIANNYAHYLTVDKDGIVYATTYNDGIYSSTDQGLTWKTIQGNFNYITVNKIVFDEHQDMFLATDESVWKKVDSVTTISLDEEQIKEYSLMQNYPNPFNPSTKIRFRIAYEGIVSLKIYNILGQEVKSLLDENKLAGSYEMNFNSGDLSSGVYFYRLSVNNFSSVKKMQVMK